MSELAYDVYEGQNNSIFVIMCHGLFGNKETLKELAIAINKDFNITVHSLDMRNHCDSFHNIDGDYQFLAGDVQTHIKRHLPNAKYIIIGFSMGGKVAFAHGMLYNGDRNCVGRIALDITIDDTGKSDTYSMWIDELLKINASNIKTKEDAQKGLEPIIPNRVIRDYLINNFIETESTIELKCNMEYIKANLYAVATFPKHLIQYFDDDSIELKISTPLFILKGTKSKFVTDERLDRMRKVFINLKSETVEGGHWCITQNFHDSYGVIHKWIEQIVN